MIRVVVVDDSALIRSLLREMIDAQPDMRVVGAASDPYAAREIIRAENPDVVTLDVEMPRMNGLDFLERIMRLRPMPVLMISSLTQRNAEATLRALELGAVDFVAKPTVGIADGVRELEREIVEKIRIAADARPRQLHASPPARRVAFESTEKILAIGASTGGTEAIAALLEAFPPMAPATVIAQHMPPVFTTGFARRLDARCRINVAEARDGERLLPGHAYVAPGDFHVRVVRRGADYVASVTQDEPVNRHRPSVDVLFASVAASAGGNALGVILTGMGADGAAGLRAMRDAGAFTVAQDEASCVIFGMPKAAIALGAACEIVPLERIVTTLSERLRVRTNRM